MSSIISNKTILSFCNQLTPAQKACLEASLQTNTGEGWLTLYRVFRAYRRDELPQLLDGPEQKVEDVRLKAFMANDVAFPFFKEKFSFRDKEWNAPVFQHLLFSAGFHHLTTCLQSALPSQREALFSHEKVDTVVLMRQAMEKNSQLDPTTFTRQLFHLSGLINENHFYKRSELRIVMHYLQLLTAPADPDTQLSPKDHLYISLASLFGLKLMPSKASFAWLMKSAQAGEEGFLQDLEAAAQKHRFAFHLSRLSRRLHAVNFSLLRSRLFNMIIDLSTEDRASIPGEISRFWCCCSELLFGFNTLFDGLPIYVEAKKLIETRFAENPQASHAEIIRLLRTTLFQNEFSATALRFCATLYKTWWYQTIPDGNRCSFNERLCDWYAHLWLNEPEKKLSCREFTKKLEETYHLPTSSLRYIPFDAGAAARAYSRWLDKKSA